MPAITTKTTTVFAVDSKLTGNARSPATIQSYLHCLSHWAAMWQMKFNESKCNVMYVGKTNPKKNCMMGHTPLQVLEKERDLGVVVSASDTLFWEEQLREMIGKEKQMTSWIIRNVVARKPEPFYKAFVRAHLEHAVQV